MLCKGSDTCFWYKLVLPLSVSLGLMISYIPYQPMLSPKIVQFHRLWISYFGLSYPSHFLGLPIRYLNKSTHLLICRFLGLFSDLIGRY